MEVKLKSTELIYKIEYMANDKVYGRKYYCLNLRRVITGSWELTLDSSSLVPTICEMSEIIQHLMNENDETSKLEIEEIVVRFAGKKDVVISASDHSEGTILKKFSEKVQIG